MGRSVKNDEKTLIKGLKKGDHDSYQSLFRLYYGKFVNFVDCIIKDRAAAEDIVQESFMKVFINREQLQEGQSIENYIYVITKRLMLNYIRDRKKRRTIDSSEIKDSIQEAWGVEDLAFAVESKSRIQTIVSKMPKQRRTVYLLSREKGLSNKDIADRLGLSVRTVDRHIALALAQSRDSFS